MSPEEKARLVIDEQLKQSGWIIQDMKDLNLAAGRGVAVREYPTSSGEVDYALFVDGVPVGIAEAKREEKGEDITTVEKQSARYATSTFKWMKGEVNIRFAYECTGELTRFTDYKDINYRSREIFSFHRPESLAYMLKQNETIRNNMKHFPELDVDGFRKCQINALKKLDESFAENRPRALVQMATGAGKTVTAITAAYEVVRGYDSLIHNLLDEDCNPSLDAPEIITLSQEADNLLEEFANEIEPKLRGEYADIADWAGKLVGAVLRISAILWRASTIRCEDFLQDEPDTEVDADTMYNAITLGRYYIEHARAAYSLMGADPVIKQCKYVLNAVKNTGLVEVSKRDIMRLCRSFRNADELQPVLDRLTEYGYIAPKQDDLPKGKGRPGSRVYLINPCIY